MKEAYYYFYYVVVIFFKNFIKREDGFPNSYYNGMLVVGFFTGLNAISIFIALMSNIPRNSGYLVAIPIVAINYYFLAWGNQGKKLFKEYNEKFNASSNKKFILTLAILYLIATLALTAIVVVNHRLKHPHGSS